MQKKIQMEHCPRLGIGSNRKSTRYIRRVLRLKIALIPTLFDRRPVATGNEAAVDCRDDAAAVRSFKEKILSNESSNMTTKTSHNINITLIVTLAQKY